MTNTNEAETREKIAEIRKRFEILRAICGPRGISRETIQEYGIRIKQLEAELASRGRQTTANTTEEDQNE